MCPVPFLVGMAFYIFYHYGASKYWAQRKFSVTLLITCWCCTPVLSSAGNVAMACGPPGKTSTSVFSSPFHFHLLKSSSNITTEIALLVTAKDFHSAKCSVYVYVHKPLLKAIDALEHQVLESFSLMIPFSWFFFLSWFFLSPLSTSSFPSGPLVGL